LPYVKISELPAASAANAADEIEANQSGVSRKLTAGQLRAGLAATGSVTASGLTMSSARVLGRTTAGTGAVEELSSVPVNLGGTGATDAGSARTNLGLGSIATQAANNVAITGGSVTGITDLAIADGGTGASTASVARTNLGVAIGTDVQAYDAELAAIAGLATNGLITRTSASTAASRTLTAGSSRVSISNGDGVAGNPTIDVSEANLSLPSIGGTLSVAKGGTGATDAATARTNLGVAIGSNVQAYDADLTAIAGLAGTSGLLRKTAADTWSLDTSSYLTGNQTVTLSGDITGSGSTAITATLANSGVAAGTYSNATVTVDAKGRVTSASSGSAGGVSSFSAGSTGLTPSTGTTGAVTLGGTLAVGNGGTGATTLTSNAVLLGNGAAAVQTVAPGASGNVLTSNGTTWVSQTAPSSSGALQAVASGSLSDGTKVIINANGTVSAVGFSPGAPTFGSKVVYRTGPSGTARVVVYDSFNQKVVVSAFNQVWVGTVSGSSISFGSPVTVPTVGGNNLAVSAAAYHANAQKIVFLCSDAAGTALGYGVVGTVSGSSISFGTPAVFNSSATANLRYAVYDPINQVVVFSYSISSVNESHVQAAAVSGTDVSFGTRVLVRNVNVLAALSYDTNAQKIVAAYVGASNFGRARVCTVTGTSISLGTDVTFNAAATSDITIVYDPNSQNHVIAFRDSNSFATARTATVSGTGFSFFGNKLTLNSIETYFTSAVYDSFAGRCVLFGLTNFSNSFAFVVSVSGTTITLNHAEIFNNGSATAFAAFDASANRVVLAYADPVNSQADTSRVMETAPPVTNLTATNFIGISNGVYTGGQTATIQTVGSVDDAQSGLVAGQAYYVQPDGTLSTTPGVPSVFAGTAVSASNLLIAKTLESLTVGTGAAVRQTNATLTNPTITNYIETLANAGSVSAYTVDLSLGTFHRLTTAANTTITLPASVTGKSFVVIVAYGGAHSLTWTGGSTLRWAGGTIPTATSVNGKIDVFSFFQDGANTFGAVIGSNF
jgi:hypothetical protein